MMSSLKDINLESVYSSEDSDILKEFYIPVLSVSKEYNRITGFFSSDSLAVAAKGMTGLIKNNGSMKLITGLFSKKEDVIIAEDVITNPDKIIKEIEQNFDIDAIENAFIKETLKAFGWMLAKGFLEIKLALPKKDHISNFPALFHQKIGIIKDIDNNEISFSGSINETGIGWKKNIEEFKVFRRWKEDELNYFNSDKIRFFHLWNNLSEKVEVIPLPQAIKEKLVRIAPKTMEELDFSILDGKLPIEVNVEKVEVKEIKLREYQQNALTAWHDNHFKGILEMATGAGKTYVGFSAIIELFNVIKRGIVIISAPTIEICRQWENKIGNFIEYDKLILVSSREPKWEGMLVDSLHDYKKNRLNRIILITTYDSLSNLCRLILDYKNLEIFLIADEVHSFGSEERGKILQNKEFENKIKYRLGLSATPERMYDQKGTDLIKSFFGNIIFTYTIGDAINDKILCPYNYYLNIVEMTNKEFRDYIEITKKLAKQAHYTTSENDDSMLTLLLNKRALIIKNSENKILILENSLEKLIKENNIKYTFIFCIDTNQLNEVKKVLEKFHLYYSQITGLENSDERKRILKEFENGGIDVLLSMKILDEGIDIPNAKNAIILASSTNPREYIQRRGRVLRKLENKDKTANIFDYIVTPPLSHNPKEEFFEMERNIVKKELTRSFEFVKYSNNKMDIFANKPVEKLITKYDISDIYKILRKN